MTIQCALQSMTIQGILQSMTIQGALQSMTMMFRWNSPCQCLNRVVGRVVLKSA